MGKPAARMGDLTAHGGTIVVGQPNVLIGRLPAATLGGMHVCPMVTGTVPHVGGPITVGSTGVMIGKRPAARVGDLVTCVGPPSMIVMGCPNVLIGEVGSSSKEGGAPGAKPGAKARKNGPKAIKPFPLEIPDLTSENRTVETRSIQCLFTDSAGKPLTGVAYRIQGPSQESIVGVSTLSGMACHDGFRKAGNCRVFVPELKNARWAKPRVKMGEEAAFSVDTNLGEEIDKATVELFEIKGMLRRQVAHWVLPVKDRKVKGAWRPAYLDLPDSLGQEFKGTRTGAGDVPAYEFVCEAGGQVAVSGLLVLEDVAEIKLVDGLGKPVPHAEYVVTFQDGSQRVGKLNAEGWANEENVPPGEFVAEIREGILGILRLDKENK